MPSASRVLILVSALWMFCGLLSLPCAAQNVKQILQASGGIAIAGPSGGPFTAGFGSVNGLGIGTPQVGLTNLSVSGGGGFYYTPYTLVVSGAGAGNPALVKAYISSGFTNGSSVLKLMSCPYQGSCTAYPGGYTTMPVSSATAVIVLPSQGVNGNYTAYLGLLVGDVNGGFTTPDSVQVTFDIYNGATNTLKHTTVLNLTSPSVAIQTAVEMQVATDSTDSGQIISFNSNTVDPNFTTNFGTVNGLGINPGTGLTVLNGAVANCDLYSTPYYLQPQYSGFSSTQTGSVTAYVSTNFAHANMLALYDSVTAGSGYSAISTMSGSPSSLTGSSYANGANVRRYLGLCVSTANGSGTFTGTETATITYTILVH